MTRSLAPYLEGNQRLFRFALYGRSGAGKTCLLAALDLVRTPNPDRYGCCRLKVLPGVKAPSSDQSIARIEKDPVAAFYAGNAFLGEAEDALQQGKLPPPNSRQPPYLMIYELTIPGRGNVRIELLDYSGELIDARNVNLDRQADLLRGHLRELDGIFVLAEAPRIGNEDETQPEELRRLRESFAILQSALRKEGRWNAPVALLLGKWDRRGKPSASAGERYQEVEEFLNGPPVPAHCQLRETLRECVTEGNFQVFAISAFGKCVPQKYQTPEGLERTREVPESFNPLPAYGLENPFVWACLRRDRIDYDAYRAGLTRGGVWRWINPLRPDTPLRCAARARNLANQLPHGSNEHKDVSTAYWGHLASALTRACSTVVLLFVLAVSWETFLVDRPTYARVHTTLNDPSATKNQREWAEGWLLDYGTAGPYRHLLSTLVVMSKWKAREDHRLRQADREETLWKAVQELKGNPQAQEAQAKTYLEFYPENGLYTIQALTLVQRAALHQRRDENERELQKLEDQVKEMIAEDKAEVETLRTWQDKVARLPRHPDAWPEDLRKRRNELQSKIGGALVSRASGARVEKERQNHVALLRVKSLIESAKTSEELTTAEMEHKDPLPYPGMMTNELRMKQDENQVQLTARRAHLTDQANWHKLTTDYDDYMSAKNVSGAARVLLKGEEEKDRWRKLRADFRKRAIPLLVEKSDEYRDEKNFDAAIKILEVNRADASVVGLLEDSDIKQLEDLISKGKTAKGQFLYDLIRKNGTIEDVDRYLTSNADQKMARAARRYREYLESMQGEQEVTVKITKISWGDWYDGYTNSARIWLEDEVILRAEVRSRKGMTSTDVGSGTVKAKVLDTVSLRVYLFYPGTFYLDKEPGGVKKYSGKLVDFREEKELVLEDDDTEGKTYPAMGARITLKVEGMKSDPGLPTWKE